ncbi:hypothetical protein N7537_001487 [Penicillium hordei]|uniref:Uncharacterized protein n=1 Tax=Penicillium hordei TaxID=40994 RepID=A0AAD6EFV9_9EURO|nr:uncharacterized protein N7537_001487 [Penicillium hordei]KAJ5616373.1 hypothetical protein N7537_001487 [Penicillium hordei]
MSIVPSSSTEAYLPACNGQVNLRDAYTWSLTQIKVFMIEIIDKHSTYGVERRVVSELKRLRTDILDLSENGTRYQSEPSSPQAISRMVNPATASEDESYFLLDKLTYGGVSYWSSFDLLGRFISLTGPAPRGTTRDNFYLPLTLMYINWYRRIAPMASSVYSCGLGNRWVKILQRARFNLRDQRTDTAGIKFEFTTLTGRGSHAIPFGNCAETYPLVNVLRLPKEGLYSHLQALDAMTKPCTNCQQVITSWGGKVENFITDDMSEKSTISTFKVQSPTSPDPGASGSKIVLAACPKRASPADNDEPAAKRARGPAPNSPRKPSYLVKGKRQTEVKM